MQESVLNPESGEIEEQVRTTTDFEWVNEWLSKKLADEVSSRAGDQDMVLVDQVDRGDLGEYDDSNQLAGMN